jgi:H+/gluconate symporter-like permease
MPDTAAIFQPTFLQWTFGAGIGTNVGASILWGFLAGIIGYFFAKFLRREFQKLHAKIEEHGAKQREHNQWAANTLAEIHAASTTVPLTPHPHFDLTPKTRAGRG